MAYDPGAIDAALAAAVGDDPVLVAELRTAFVESAKGALSALRQAPDTAAWRSAGLRLKGLAASFGAVRLMALADEAARADCGDRALIARVARAIDRL